MNKLSQISPISDDDAARAVRASTLADLAGQISVTSLAEAAEVPVKHRRARRAIVPAVAGLAATAAIVALAVGPGPVRTSKVQLTAALSFTSSGGYLTVKVVDPLADPSRYRAEFARHHLNVTLRLVPASPSIVGTLVYFEQPTGGGITSITAKGRCYTGGGGSVCPVGVRIPLSFRGEAEIVFGRAARPGEQYISSAPATAPGEVMHGMTFAGQTVGQLLAELRQRDVTVPIYDYDDHGYGRHLDHVPARWFVYDAVPWASRQVMLFVGPVWPQPLTTAPASGAPAPVPSASAS